MTIGFPIATRKPRIASIKPDKIPTTFCINLNNPCNLFIIIGRLTSAQPTKITPKKSIILPKNPLVLLVTILPSFFATPVIEDDSNSSSRFFLLTFSLLLAKNSPSFLISLLLNKFVSLVCFKISSDFCFAFVIPFEKDAKVFLIELILIDDFLNEFLREVIDIIYTP